jgi:hypothetical protein
MMAGAISALGPKVVQRKIEERMEARAAAGGEAPDPVAVAQSGIRGGGGELPHRDQIQKSYGVDLGGVQAHHGPEATAACEQLGARAFAVGNHVAFADGSPSLHLAAHEAAHVVQQQHGVHLSSKMGAPGDSWERAADTAADAAVAGKRADLPETASIRAATTGPVQCYYESSDVGKSGKPYRVSNDGVMAVRQDEGPYGGQVAFATPDKIKASSKELEAATSVIRLEPGKSTIDSHDERTPDKKIELVDIVPVNTRSPQKKGDKKFERADATQHETKDFDMQLWADCGRSARTVTGADSGDLVGDGGGKLTAHFKGEGGKDQFGDPNEAIEIQKIKIVYEQVKDKVDAKKLTALLEGYKNKSVEMSNAWKAKNAAEKANKADEAKLKEKEYNKLKSQRAGILEQLNTLVYSAVDSSNRRTVEAGAGINRYADPAIGEAYHISTGGERHKDLDPSKGNWNFHWGGVIMKASEDNMTLENYASGGFDNANNKWDFQMYGVFKQGDGTKEERARRHKEGQTFHEQHRDVHKQHGQLPTTMAMGKKP